MKGRLLSIAGGAGFLTIALAGSAIAGGGGWPPAPGTYRMADTTAYASLSGPPTTVCDPVKGCGPGPSDFASVSVDRGLHTFKPKGGAKIVQQSGTMLNLEVINQSGGDVFGCWIIPDADFLVAGDLSGATLSTTVPAQSNCPGDPLAVGPSNVILGKGGGGGGGGGGTPITISVSWTSKGVVSHVTADSSYTCATFKTTSAFDTDQASASSQGQFSNVSETMTSDFASISQSSNKQVVKGTLPDACQ